MRSLKLLPIATALLAVAALGQTKLDLTTQVKGVLPPANGGLAPADKAKLDGIAPAATANSTDAQLRDRTTHTGEQAIATVNGLQPALDAKLDDSQLSAYGATLIDDANAGAARTTLGLGTAATAATGDFDAAGAAASAVSAHAAEADPHPVYLTAPEGDVAYAASAHVGAGGTAHANAVASGAAGFMTGADKAKLDGIASGATANATDAQLRDRSTHTGTQGAATITGLSGIATSGSAADLSGNLAIARLGGGVNASATTFWRGDGSWAVVEDSRMPTLQTEFTHNNAVQDDFTMAIIGTGASFTTAPAAATLGPNHPGVQLWRSGTTANSGVQAFTVQTTFRLGGGEQWDVHFWTPAAFTGTTFRSGFGDQLTSTAFVDGVWIEFSGSAAVTCKTRSNSTETASATVATLSASTWYHGRITLNAGATSATCQIFDDSGTSQGSQAVTTNIPTASGREAGWGTIATNSGTVAADLVAMDRMRLTNPGRTVQRGAQ